MRFSLLLFLFVLWLNVDVSVSQNEPLGCENPPPLTDGDIKYSVENQYNHNVSVEYMCQQFYVMEGEPYRTCINGEWTGQMRCLKPCTVVKNEIRRLNIAFKYTDGSKVYATHNDVIEFKCTKGSPVNTVGMRQKCNDGVLLLPRCQ